MVGRNARTGYGKTIRDFVVVGTVRVRRTLCPFPSSGVSEGKCRIEKRQIPLSMPKVSLPNKMINPGRNSVMPVMRHERAVSAVAWDERIAVSGRWSESLTPIQCRRVDIPNRGKYKHSTLSEAV